MADSAGSIASWINSQANVITNVAKVVPSLEKLLTASAYLIGIAIFVKAIYSLKVYGESRTMMSNNANIKEPLIYFLVAAVFIYLPTGLQVVMSSTFGYSNVLAYAPVDSSNPTISALFGSGSAVGKPLTMIIQLIGMVAFIRGWILISRSASQGQQPGGVGKGFVHVFGGILAINIVGTMEIINNTLYGSG